MNNEAQRAAFEAWVRDVPLHDRTPWIVWQAASAHNNNSALREVLRRCVRGIDHLSAIARLWEPDYSTGSDRRGWLLANDAADDAKKLLASLKPMADDQPLTNAWKLRMVYFDENGEACMHREP